MIEFLFEHVDRGFVLFAVLLVSTTAVALCTRYRAGQEGVGVLYDEVHDEDSQKR